MRFINNAWYCAAFSDEIKAEPLGRTYLDQPVVLYRKPDGGVAALSDVCPHRFAPLHEGQLNGDRLSCPYHGLTFDSSGACVHNPHGTGKIPPRSSLRVYPVAERQGVVWIWMGEPGHADTAKIVDLKLIGGEGHPRVQGHIKMAAGYQLIIDNLLDLNHAPYLHGGTLSPIGKTRETRSEHAADTAASHYLMRSVSTPISQQLWFEEPTGDYHVSMDWTAPSTLRQSIAMTGEGRPPEEGAVTRGAHLLAPETETSTHYFWVMSRNRKPEDAAANAALKRIIENAFVNEDGPMMEACQRNMRGREFAALRPVFLETDGAPGYARSVLERMSTAQANV